MTKYAIIIFGTSLIMSSSAQAQVAERAPREALTRMLGTNSVSVRPEFSDGLISGCSVQFAVLAQDRVYKNGGFIRVQGSFGVLLVTELAGRRATAFINMVLHDVNPQNLMQSVPAAPASVYFVSEDFTTSKQYEVRRDTDAAGAVITVFRFMPTLPFILDGLARNKVTIAFSRKLGGMGVLVPIDTSVEQTADDGTRRRSPKAQLEFLNCGERLFPPK